MAQAGGFCRDRLIVELLSIDMDVAGSCGDKWIGRWLDGKN